MAFEHGNAVAHGGDGGVCGLEAGGVIEDGAEELANLFLELLLFVLDEGDDVAEDVEGGYAGIAGAGDSLHGGDEQLLDAEALMERREGEDEADGAAVGVGDEESAGGIGTAAGGLGTR